MWLVIVATGTMGLIVFDDPGGFSACGSCCFSFLKSCLLNTQLKSFIGVFSMKRKGVLSIMYPCAVFLMSLC